MKKLSIKEKAIAYDEAIERLRNAFYDNNSRMCEEYRNAVLKIIEPIFPELAESNDENIRKEMLQIAKESEDTFYMVMTPNKRKHLIDWLEKQGKKIKPIEGFNTEFERQISHIIASTINKEYEYTEDSVKWVSNALLNYAKHEFEKQGEQKPADKIEPKFKVGDWVVNNTTLNSCHILKVEHGQYICDDCSFPITKENEYHLWTIQDAKDGDVLVRDIYPSGPSIYIFKEFVPQTFSMKVHCSINNKGQFLHNHDVYYYSYDATLYPAAKEQRDLLFQKMQEAGYEWDAEKKELTKIEQTSANEIPYPETLEKAIDLYYYSYGNGEGEFEHLSLEKFRDIVHTFVSDYGQKPAVWTEEDEKFFKTALWHISNSISNGKSTDIHCDTTDWFKSLKDRLQAQKGE